MLRALCLAMTLVVVPLGSAPADDSPALGRNAALVYWQAFATLPTLTRYEQDRLGQCLTMPVAALVGYSIEQHLSEALAQGLPALADVAIDGLKRRLDALPAGEGPAAALRNCEEKTLDWWVRKVKRANDEEGLIDLLALVTQT